MSILIQKLVSTLNDIETQAKQLNDLQVSPLLYSVFADVQIAKNYLNKARCNMESILQTSCKNHGFLIGRVDGLTFANRSGLCVFGSGSEPETKP